MSPMSKIIVPVLWVVILFLPHGGQATEINPNAELEDQLSRLIRNGGVAVGKNGSPSFLFAIEERDESRGRFIPASIIKLGTALTAFQELGRDYRFRTAFYRDQAGNFYLRGLGDPFLVSEEWALIARELASAGAFREPIRDLVVDESAFHPSLEVDGATKSLNPYDARLGALVSNFNTIFVEVTPGKVIRSAEPQTPLTPLAKAKARGLPPGKHRINFSLNPADGPRYSGELARAFFMQSGAKITGKIRRGKTPEGLQPVLLHQSSKTLSEVVKGMLEFSNNYIANQIVLVMGMLRQGEPATLEKGVALIRDHLVKQIGLRPGTFDLSEGSGLSRLNRITLADMLKVTEAFRPHRDLFRPYGTGPWSALAKTGTLTGVSSLAGYLPGTGHSFVIIINQSRNTRWSIYKHLARSFGAPDKNGAPFAGESPP